MRITMSEKKKVTSLQSTKGEERKGVKEGKEEASVPGAGIANSKYLVGSRWLVARLPSDNPMLLLLW
jgi:hypothetical protein